MEKVKELNKKISNFNRKIECKRLNIGNYDFILSKTKN